MTSPLHTILLVEEDSRRRADETRALVDCGLRVLVTDDAAGALEVLARNPDAITLVVTDLDIEPSGGFNLARAIHRRWSTMPVAVVTGEPTHALAIRASPPASSLTSRPLRP